MCVIYFVVRKIMLNNKSRTVLTLLGLSMYRNKFIYYVFLFVFLWCGITFANDKEINTTTSSGGNQIIVSPINILLDLGELSYVNALVIDKDGTPVEAHKIQLIPQDKKMVSIASDSSITNQSGYIYFSILGKQQGDTVVTISDGVISSYINIAIKNLIHYVLPYFYGDMQLSLINPSEAINYVKIQFHENSDRTLPPVIVRLEGKEMKEVKVSEEIDIALSDGWVEISSTEIVIGGVWTNKGYLSFIRIKE
jgi:hypothetical protein